MVHSKGIFANNIRTILIAWLIAGTLDISSAFIDYYFKTNKGPEGVLRYVASGVFGKEAFTGSAVMIWMGLLFHYIIALIFTIVFFIFYTKTKLLHYNVLITAVIFGLIIWAVMNLIVVPLSNTSPKASFNIAKAIKAALILIFMIGLPLAFTFKNHIRKFGSTTSSN